MKNPVKEVLKESGLSQLDAARKLNTTQPSLSKFSNQHICGTVNRAAEYSVSLDIKRPFTVDYEDYSIRVTFKK